MKKLHLLTTAAVLMVVMSGPSFAASRSHHTRTMNSTVQFADPANPMNSFGSASDLGRGNGAYWYGTGQNLPYPDRPYGDPDRD
jgi:hypothetical protein